jgi:hypothetical protein
MPYLVPDAVHEPLYAIVPYFNPWRWKSREKHTLRAIKHFADSGAVVVLVEAAYNRRDFTLANSGLDGALADCKIQDLPYRHKYIGLRTTDELWLKENLINVGVSSLPWDWKQVCWLDSDVHFIRPNWVGECIHKLQHYSFLQMFSHARDVGPNNVMLPEDYPHANGVSFVTSWQDGDLEENLAAGPPVPASKIIADVKAVASDVEKLKRDLGQLARDLEADYYYYGHRRVWSGLAWACTRKAWDDVGGLIDWAIWGGGDWHMAHALIGKTNGMMHSRLHPHYKAMVTSWYEKAERYIRHNVGVMEGSIIHYWHGKKIVRGYGDKHRVLSRLGFDPIAHLKRDYQGLWQLHDDGSKAFIGLRDEFRKIAHERNEDSIDL